MCKVLIDCVDGILHILDSEAYSQNATALLKTLIDRNLVKTVSNAICRGAKSLPIRFFKLPVAMLFISRGRS